MALRELRGVLRPPQRHLGARPRGVRLLAAVEGLAGRHAGSRPDVPQEDGGVLGDMADARSGRRGAPRRVRGRAMGGPGRGGADRLHGAPRPLLAPRARRDERRVEVAALEGGAARRRRHRRRQRIRQGRRGRMAPHQGAEVRLSRVLPGQAQFCARALGNEGPASVDNSQHAGPLFVTTWMQAMAWHQEASTSFLLRSEGQLHGGCQQPRRYPCKKHDGHRSFSFHPLRQPSTL